MEVYMLMIVKCTNGNRLFGEYAYTDLYDMTLLHATLMREGKENFFVGKANILLEEIEEIIEL